MDQILLETGDVLLLETGDDLLLELQPGVTPGVDPTPYRYASSLDSRRSANLTG